MIDEVLQNIHHVGRYVVEWYRRVAAAFCPICLSMKTTNAVFQIDCEIYLWIFTVWKVAGVFFPLSWYQVIPRVPNHKPEQIFLLRKEMLVKFYLALPPESRESPTVTFSLVIHWPAIIFMITNRNTATASERESHQIWHPLHPNQSPGQDTSWDFLPLNETVGRKDKRGPLGSVQKYTQKF